MSCSWTGTFATWSWNLLIVRAMGGPWCWANEPTLLASRLGPHRHARLDWLLCFSGHVHVSLLVHVSLSWWVFHLRLCQPNCFSMATYSSLMPCCPNCGPFPVSDPTVSWKVLLVLSFAPLAKEGLPHKTVSRICSQSLDLLSSRYSMPQTLFAASTCFQMNAIQQMPPLTVNVVARKL
jgi:hypothetical protein